MQGQAPDLADRFFALSNDLVCIADFRGYFKRLTPTWEKTLGYSLEELLSMPMFDFVHPEDRERTLEQNRTVRAGGQAHAFENRYRCKDGTYRWLAWNSRADLDHQVIYGVARDVTELKRAEEEREQLVQHLQNTLAEMRAQQHMVPICMYCKSIRHAENDWQSIELYLSQRTKTTVSHGICPACYKHVVEPQIESLMR